MPSEFLVHPFCYMVLHFKTLFLMSYMPNFTLHGQNFKESFKAQKAELRPSPGHPVLLRQVPCFNGLCPDYVIFKKPFLWQKPGLSLWDKRKNSRWDVDYSVLSPQLLPLMLFDKTVLIYSFINAFTHSFTHPVRVSWTLTLPEKALGIGYTVGTSQSLCPHGLQSQLRHERSLGNHPQHLCLRLC